MDINKLPDELIEKIFNYLTRDDKFNLCLVNKRFFEIFNNRSGFKYRICCSHDEEHASNKLRNLTRLKKLNVRLIEFVRYHVKCLWEMKPDVNLQLSDDLEEFKNSINSRSVQSVKSLCVDNGIDKKQYDDCSLLCNLIRLLPNLENVLLVGADFVRDWTFGVKLKNLVWRGPFYYQESFKNLLSLLERFDYIETLFIDEPESEFWLEEPKCIEIIQHVGHERVLDVQLLMSIIKNVIKRNQDWHIHYGTKDANFYLDRETLSANENFIVGKVGRIVLLRDGGSLAWCFQDGHKVSRGKCYECDCNHKDVLLNFNL